ncbi:hypothetical protein DUI87_35180 [Hirundo rustica rustica]|uniref:Uncharacterized protein n=1 Tax=Hirundo rustica rustica TaxID=333673 RepID=A0A3M0IJ67_HIRRU|nr:hypothetical protein DUI87_35180 [Hirundo rustica rustica]
MALEVMDQKSVQKEELPGGSSCSVAASAAERKEMADTNTVTDTENARAGPPTGKNKATGQKESLEEKNSRKQIVEERHKGHAKPVREGDLDYQPISITEPLEDAEVVDQKSVQKEELPGGSSGSVAASAAERKEMADTNTVTDADKARAAKPVDEGGLHSQPTFRMEVLEDAEDTIRRMGAEIQVNFKSFGCGVTVHSVSSGNASTQWKEIHDWKVQLTSTAEKEQDYLNQLLTLKTDLEQKANELESLKEKMAKTSEEIKSKLDEREENVCHIVCPENM